MRVLGEERTRKGLRWNLRRSPESSNLHLSQNGNIIDMRRALTEKEEQERLEAWKKVRELREEFPAQTGFYSVNRVEVDNCYTWQIEYHV
jgi:hypothetical protein